MITRIILIMAVVCDTMLSRSQPVPGFTTSTLTPLSTGYYLLTVLKSQGKELAAFNIILDSSAIPVYYYHLPRAQTTSDFKFHNTGQFSYHSNKKVYLLDHTLKCVDSLTCVNGVTTDDHDFLMTEGKNIVLLGNENLRKDLMKYRLFSKKNQPGSDTATVKSNVIQEINNQRKVVFEWHAWDHYNFDDIDTAYLKEPHNVDWTHVNAIEHHRDGNLLINARNFNEVTKVSRETGKILWRLGGKKNQFRFMNDSQMFVAQHNIVMLKNGNITLFDNGDPGPPFHPATAREYRLDEKNLTATLVWSYTDNAQSHSRKGTGNVQRLDNGNTLINYGHTSNSQVMFNIIDRNGKKLFEILQSDTFRVYRVYSVSLPQLNKQRPRIRSRVDVNDGIYLSTATGHQKYLWSTGDTTQSIKVKNKGVYFVYVSQPHNGSRYGMIRSPDFNFDPAKPEEMPAAPVKNKLK
jgi:hypothetical protein